MNVARCWRHLCHTRWALWRRFPDATLARIEHAIAAAEKLCAGEICVALEGDLDLAALLRDQTSRQRAAEVFAMLGVWNTPHRNGVLIHVLLADRDVEILADRGLDGLVTASEWENVCRAMERDFSSGRWEQGVLVGVEMVGGLIAQHFPAREGDRRNLPDRPALL